jgi:hypothetical protein
VVIVEIFNADTEILCPDEEHGAPFKTGVAQSCIGTNTSSKYSYFAKNRQIVMSEFQ